MNYLSVCSGIEAATVAWECFGWRPVGFSEIDKFPSAVLDYHYPHVTNYGDMLNYKEWEIDEKIDLLVGGTPCTSWSVAGKQEGLKDPRGQLTLSFIKIAERFKPRWIVWENVPGVFSTNGGRDFGTFIRALEECGYGWAYRILDARFFGVPQKRRRVFLVGYLGDFQRAARVLFEQESLRGDTQKSRENRKNITREAEASTDGCSKINKDSENNVLVLMDQGGSSMSVNENGSVGTIRSEMHGNIPIVLMEEKKFKPEYYEHHPKDSRVKGPKDLADTVTASYGTGGNSTPLILTAYSISGKYSRGMLSGNPHTGCAREASVSRTVDTTDPNPSKNQGGVLIVEDTTPKRYWDDGLADHAQDKSETLRTRDDNSASGLATPQDRVRQLTPTECERLQGFPDDYTNIPWRGKDCSPKTLRYKAIGNSMCVNVMRWIGARIAIENERE